MRSFVAERNPPVPHDCTCPVCGSSVADIPLQILPERGMVIAGSKFVVLTGQQMALLAKLAEIFPRVLTKEAALDFLYQLDPDGEAEAKIVDVLVCHIRRKVKPLGLRIDTQWGKGYALSMPVHTAGKAA
jgi:DNA-binding response OmpR family regulator